MASSSIETKINDILFNTNREKSNSWPPLTEVESHENAREEIYKHLLTKEVSPYRANIIANMIMNIAVYGVEYSKNQMLMIRIALDKK